MIDESYLRSPGLTDYQRAAIMFALVAGDQGEELGDRAGFLRDVAALLSLDLSVFCTDDEPSSIELSRPFVQKGYRYATDGRIAVRLPAQGEPDDDDHSLRHGKRYPDMAAGVPWKHNEAETWYPWPEQDWLYCDEELLFQTVGPCDIDAGLDEKIRALPWLTFAPYMPPIRATDHCVILFRFGAVGEGVVMPLGDGGPSEAAQRWISAHLTLND